MDIEYITTDFEIESSEDLTELVKELEKEMVLQLNRWVENKYRVSLSGPGHYDRPEDTITDFCELIENLSTKSLNLYLQSNKRIADIGFNSGKEPSSISYDLSEEILERLYKINTAIRITIYPLDKYRDNEKQK